VRFHVVWGAHSRSSMLLRVTVWGRCGGFAGKRILEEEGNNRLAPSSTANALVGKFWRGDYLNGICTAMKKSGFRVALV